MNLIFIYGPPAVGKLTVAKELSKLTGYKIFHNHLTQDLAREIYPEFNVKRFGLVNKIRLDVFDHACKNNTDLIFTFVYSTDCDDQLFVKDVINTITKGGGNIYFVQLSAEKDVLLNRVEDDSRKKFYKINNKQKLSEILDNNNNFSDTVEYDGVLMIDTDVFDAILSAKTIANNFKL